MLSSIQSLPHNSQTVAGTSLTTTTPKPKSTVKVVVDLILFPLQNGSYTPVVQSPLLPFLIIIDTDDLDNPKNSAISI